jgi:hypothetical protein
LLPRRISLCSSRRRFPQLGLRKPKLVKIAADWTPQAYRLSGGQEQHLVLVRVKAAVEFSRRLGAAKYQVAHAHPRPILRESSSIL